VYCIVIEDIPFDTLIRKYSSTPSIVCATLFESKQRTLVRKIRIQYYSVYVRVCKCEFTTAYNSTALDDVLRTQVMDGASRDQIVNHLHEEYYRLNTCLSTLCRFVVTYCQSCSSYSFSIA
jgi:hypothetical protein